MRFLIVLFLLLILNAAKAEVVSPTFKSSKSLVGVVNDPSDVDFSPDGKKIFISGFSGLNIKQFTVTTPFDITTIDTSSVVTLNLNSGDDNISTHMQGFAFNDDGTKIYSIANINSSKSMSIHTLATPYDLSSASQDADDGKNWLSYLDPLGGTNVTHRDIEFNNDGTKMYLIHAWLNEAMIEYNLSTPYVPSSASLGTVLDLNDINQDIIQDFEFDDDGTRMYLQESGAANDTHKIYVYKLSTPFAISSAKYVGKLLNFFKADGTGQALPLGLDFSADGMKLYQVAYSHDGNTDPPDFIYQYDLKCPYGIVICETDVTSNVSTQVDFAKNVIHNNTSTVFKRFEWLRRNKNNYNLNSHNIKLNIYNPALASLSNNLQDQINTKLLAKKLQASTKNSGIHESKIQKWSFWSHGDVSLGRIGDTITTKPKKIRTSGLTFGIDRKINENKFVGAALRMGKDDVDVIFTGAPNFETESLTLNLYSAMSFDKSNLDALLGFSLLRIGQFSSSKNTGNRNGKQAFTSLNFKSKTSYGNLNIIPMGKIDFGVTSFSEYTDFGTSTTSSDIYESHTFKSGGITTGFVFDSLFLMNEGTTRPNGSFEYIADFTPDTDYQYKTTGGSTSISNNVEKHSLHNLKGNIGIETIFSDHTLSISYERLQSLNESAHYDNLFFKLGYLPKKNTELAINFSPLQNYQTNINYKKNINGFDIKFGSNYSLMSKIPVYGVNFEIGATY